MSKDDFDSVYGDVVKHTDLIVDVAGDGTDYQISTKAGRDKAVKLMADLFSLVTDSTEIESRLIKQGVKPADAAALFVELGE